MEYLSPILNLEMLGQKILLPCWDENPRLGNKLSRRLLVALYR